MSEYVFDAAAFRAAYPAFSNVTLYPTVTLDAYWATAGCFVENTDSSCLPFLTGACREKALYMMTAHLAALATIVAAGKTPGLVSSATIDKISVTLQTPPEADQWQWWLNLTPYGMQLLALLQVSSVGGFCFGGSPETLAIRGIGGFIL